MLKKVIAVVLIVLAGGTWLYLDHLNKLELQQAEETRQAMIQAREQAAARAQARARFEAELSATLTGCKEQASAAKTAFLEAHKKPVKRKPGQFTIPEEIAAQADDTLAAAEAACQKEYDARLAQGQ